jgi:chromosome partitioning protein
MTLDDSAMDIPLDDYTRPCESPERNEHPSVVLRDLAARRRPHGHVIAFANEKGGVGKSTFAFHCALALTHLDLRVLVIDCDRRQQSLHRLLEARDGTVRALKVELPQPKHVVLEQQSGALLSQEIERVGAGCDFVLLDLAGHDSPLARRAIALANTVVTPINCSPTDLDALGRINAVSRRFREASPFAAIVTALRDECLALGNPAFDWVVAKNRVRRCEHRLLASIDQNLATMARHLGFRTIDGLTERVSYRELMPFGLTQLDLKLIPDLPPARSANLRELRQLIEGLRLPRPGPAAQVRRVARDFAPILARSAQSFREALSAATPAGALAVPATADAAV